MFDGGIGYLSPVAQLKSSTLSVFAIFPVREPLLERAAYVARALGAQQEALLLRELGDAFVDGVVVDGDGPPAGLAHRTQDEEVAHGGWYFYAHRAPRVRVIDASRELLARLERVHYGRAAGGLHGDHLGQLGVGEIRPSSLSSANAFHIPMRPAAPSGVHDDVRQVVPPELL